MDDLTSNAGATSISPTAEADLSSMTSPELLALWSSVMNELEERGVIRSSNNPTADYAEFVVAKKLGLELVPRSTYGYDAIAPKDRTRFQIKGRRLTPKNSSRQLGILRKLDENGFDYLVAVLFGPSFELLEMWMFPIDLVREHAKYRDYVNGYIIHAQGPLLRDPRAVRL